MSVSHIFEGNRIFFSSIRIPTPDSLLYNCIIDIQWFTPMASLSKIEVTHTHTLARAHTHKHAYTHTHTDHQILYEPLTLFWPCYFAPRQIENRKWNQNTNRTCRNSDLSMLHCTVLSATVDVVIFLAFRPELCVSSIHTPHTHTHAVCCLYILHGVHEALKSSYFCLFQTCNLNQ